MRKLIKRLALALFRGRYAPKSFSKWFVLFFDCLLFFASFWAYIFIKYLYHFQHLNINAEFIHFLPLLAAFLINAFIMGIYCIKSKKAKAFGFWANTEVIPVEDVKGYNRALGKLWCVYGVLFILIGLPLLDKQNSSLLIITMLGTLFISIATMIVYVVGIEAKYRKGK